ncbi:hypothetical protein [Ranid herpesvirus 3]|uniref:Uncharacterized protein n=1 Tax=Ranid herpesvirus 3 TaxID=1987509 RepID=A0A1X9T569_9VIRU|nr:hypothetical protein [Ranid herpesvirus 3]ARR28848.1 hypothetical protein [Ranid herpesvirus 3]
MEVIMRSSYLSTFSTGMLKQQVKEEFRTLENFEVFATFVKTVGECAPPAPRSVAVLYYAWHHEHDLSKQLFYPGLDLESEGKLNNTYFKHRHSWSAAWVGKQDMRLLAPPSSINVHSFCWILANLLGTASTNALLKDEKYYTNDGFNPLEKPYMGRRFLLDVIRAKLSKLDTVALFHLIEFLNLKPTTQEDMVYSMMESYCCIEARFNWSFCKKVKNTPWNKVTKSTEKLIPLLIAPKYSRGLKVLNSLQCSLGAPSFVLTLARPQFYFQLHESSQLANLYLVKNYHRKVHKTKNIQRKKHVSAEPSAIQRVNASLVNKVDLRKRQLFELNSKRQFKPCAHENYRRSQNFIPQGLRPETGPPTIN